MLSLTLSISGVSRQQNLYTRRTPGQSLREAAGPPEAALRRSRHEHPGGVWELSAAQEADGGPARRDVPRRQGRQGGAWSRSSCCGSSTARGSTARSCGRRSPAGPPSSRRCAAPTSAAASISGGCAASPTSPTTTSRARTWRRLLAQADRQGSPIPADHALLIAERVALALAAASESRVGDERVLHGFVVPQLVMVSNEGETRLLGFEAAPGLRASRRRARPTLDPAYLAPETPRRARRSRKRRRRLVARRPPLRAPDRRAAARSARRTATARRSRPPACRNEGGPLPPAVVALLEKSLVPTRGSASPTR